MTYAAFVTLLYIMYLYICPLTSLSSFPSLHPQQLERPLCQQEALNKHANPFVWYRKDFTEELGFESVPWLAIIGNIVIVLNEPVTALSNLKELPYSFLQLLWEVMDCQ